MTRLPPGYDRVAADGDLAGVLGLEAHGFLLLLMRMAEPVAHPPGAWVVMLSREDIGIRAGTGRAKTSALLALLERTGVIITEPGRKLGRGFGSTPARRFLATDASLTLPDGGGGIRQVEVGTSQDRPVIPQPIHRHLTPVRDHSTGPQLTHLTTDNDDESSQGAKTNRPNPAVMAALRKVGWHGPPPSTDAPDDVIIALAHWVAARGNITSPGAYLRRILTSEPGGATRLAAELGLITPLGSTDAYADAVTRMSHDEYVQRCIADPDWEQQVMRAARARAVSEGTPMSMMLVREVAAELAS